MVKGIKDAHLTKKEILIKRGIIKEDDSENILHQRFLPRGFSLNLCGHCTYKCTYCPQSFRSHPQEYIKEEIVHKVFNELGDLAVYVQMGTRGENLLHPNFFYFIDFIKNKNEMSYICLNTNGYIIDDDMMMKLIESGIDHIIFSLQTINPQLYFKTTGSPHHKKIVERIISFKKALEESKVKMFLSVQFLGFPENLPFKQQFIDFWKFHGVNIQIQRLHVWGDKFKAEEAIGDADRYPCPYLWLYPTVSHSGKLTVCFADFYDEMAYGSLEEESLASLWQGKKTQAIREKHLRGEWVDLPMCKNCYGYKLMGNGFEYRNGRFFVPDKRIGQRRTG